MTLLRLFLPVLLCILFCKIPECGLHSFDAISGCNRTPGYIAHCEKQLCFGKSDQDFLGHVKWECVKNTLTRMELSNNQLNLSDFDVMAAACSGLTELDLSHNNIESLRTENMKLFRHLRFLDISYNKNLCGWEKAFPQDVFSQNAALRVVLFQGCDEEFPVNKLDNITRDMKQHLGFKHVLILNQDYAEQPQDKSLADADEIHPEDSINILIPVFAVSMLLMVIVIGVLGYCLHTFRKEVREYRPAESEDRIQLQPLNISERQHEEVEEELGTSGPSRPPAPSNPPPLQDIDRTKPLKS